MTKSTPPITMGIEEELFLVETESRDLITELPPNLLAECQAVFPKQIVQEFLTCQFEIISVPCTSIAALRDQLLTLRKTVIEKAGKYGIAPIAASTHPYCVWQKQRMNKSPRYRRLADKLKIAANRMLITGMHLHIGVEDPPQRLRILNKLTWFLPHILSLSTSSPYWGGVNSGFNSFRMNILNGLPRSGLPPYFQSIPEYESYVNKLVKAGCIEDASEIWWDARLSCRFPTVEMRATDVCTHAEDACSIAALLLSLIRWLEHDDKNFYHLDNVKNQVATENRFLAQRYRLADKGFVDMEEARMIPAETFYSNLIEKLRDDADSLGCLPELENVMRIVQTGTSADRQKAAYDKAIKAGADNKQALTKVVDHLIEETRTF